MLTTVNKKIKFRHKEYLKNKSEFSLLGTIFLHSYMQSP